MPPLYGRPPKYCRHKASGQATVTLNGQVIYLPWPPQLVQESPGALGYITPEDSLNGMEPVIFAERDRKLEEARRQLECPQMLYQGL